MREPSRLPLHRAVVAPSLLLPSGPDVIRYIVSGAGLKMANGVYTHAPHREDHCQCAVLERRVGSMTFSLCRFNMDSGQTQWFITAASKSSHYQGHDHDLYHCPKESGRFAPGPGGCWAVFQGQQRCICRGPSFGGRAKALQGVAPPPSRVQQISGPELAEWWLEQRPALRPRPQQQQQLQRPVANRSTVPAPPLPLPDLSGVAAPVLLAHAVSSSTAAAANGTASHPQSQRVAMLTPGALPPDAAAATAAVTAGSLSSQPPPQPQQPRIGRLGKPLRVTMAATAPQNQAGGESRLSAGAASFLPPMAPPGEQALPSAFAAAAGGAGESAEARPPIANASSIAVLAEAACTGADVEYEDEDAALQQALELSMSQNQRECEDGMADAVEASLTQVPPCDASEAAAVVPAPPLSPVGSGTDNVGGLARTDRVAGNLDRAVLDYATSAAASYTPAAASPDQARSGTRRRNVVQLGADAAPPTPPTTPPSTHGVLSSLPEEDEDGDGRRGDGTTAWHDDDDDTVDYEDDEDYDSASELQHSGRARHQGRSGGQVATHSSGNSLVQQEAIRQMMDMCNLTEAEARDLLVKHAWDIELAIHFHFGA